MKMVEVNAASVVPTWLADYATLVRLRLTALVVVSVLVGFYLGHAGPVLGDGSRGVKPTDSNPWAGTLAATMVGIVLVIAGANAANQWLERKQDALMARTANRPLATGRLSAGHVVRFSACLSVAGLMALFMLVNPACAGLAVTAWILYLCVYTPLKRVTSRSVLVGAVSGALPPVIGWTAAAGGFEAKSLVLFSIVFVWQLPHFQSIAWLYREDYARARYPVLPVVEPTGKRTAVEMIAYSLILIPLSLLPTFFRMAGFAYYTGAMILGFVFLAFALEVARLRTRASARQHLLASLAYLTLLFVLMTLDKVPSQI
ncbi:MAG: heme o synthase [Phycisphaerae bacterium]